MQRRRDTQFHHLSIEIVNVNRDPWKKRVVNSDVQASQHNEIDKIYGKKIWFKCITVCACVWIYMQYAYCIRNNVTQHTHTPNRRQTRERERARKRNGYCVRQRIKIDQCRVHGKYFNVIEMHTKERAQFSCIHILASLSRFFYLDQEIGRFFKINEYKSFAYVVLNSTASIHI